MANFPIDETLAAVNQELRKIETSDPVHADVYNELLGQLINNDAFLERLAKEMIRQSMISHVLDSVNPNMVLGADVGPKITTITDALQQAITVLNTNSEIKNGVVIFTKYVTDVNYSLKKQGNIAVFSFLANVSQFPTINDDDYFFCTLPDGFLPQNMYFGGGHVSYFGSWKSGAFLRLRESGHVAFMPTIPFSEDFSFRGTISYFVE